MYNITYLLGQKQQKMTCVTTFQTLCKKPNMTLLHFTHVQYKYMHCTAGPVSTSMYTRVHARSTSTHTHTHSLSCHSVDITNRADHFGRNGIFGSLVQSVICSHSQTVYSSLSLTHFTLINLTLTHHRQIDR